MTNHRGVTSCYRFRMRVNSARWRPGAAHGRTARGGARRRSGAVALPGERPTTERRRNAANAESREPGMQGASSTLPPLPHPLPSRPTALSSRGNSLQGGTARDGPIGPGARSRSPPSQGERAGAGPIRRRDSVRRRRFGQDIGLEGRPGRRHSVDLCRVHVPNRESRAVSQSRGCANENERSVSVIRVRCKRSTFNLHRRSSWCREIS